MITGLLVALLVWTPGAAPSGPSPSSPSWVTVCRHVHGKGHGHRHVRCVTVPALPPGGPVLD